MRHDRMRGSVKEGSRGSKKIVVILSIVVAVLILVILYFFVAQPQMNKYVAAKQYEGVNYALASILSGIQTQGFVQMPISENQSVILAYVTPEELQFLQQVRSQQAQQSAGGNTAQ
ncbi:MAG: hypothetical protein PF542_04810 [Nanoarchaeota archaeon]|jgi:hypothetical protein|nr:hypothetical protein [Nanoarchaeota archaeon]